MSTAFCRRGPARLRALRRFIHGVQCAGDSAGSRSSRKKKLIRDIDGLMREVQALAQSRILMTGHGALLKQSIARTRAPSLQANAESLCLPRTPGVTREASQPFEKWRTPASEPGLWETLA